MTGKRETRIAAKSGIILFLGAPGSGKGTQCARLARQLGIRSLSTGDMLRAEAERDTPVGHKLREIMASGALVDDELVFRAVKARLERDLPGRRLILDGFPRNVAQARCLDWFLAEQGVPGPTVLHLEVPRDKLLARMTARRHCGKCGAIYNLLSRPSSRHTLCENDGEPLLHRNDDKEAVIRRRFIEFDLACAPLVEHYSGRNPGDYHRIDGDRDPDVIASELLRIMGRRQARAAA